MKYCAFLRGVNIGGKSMKMADVVQVFESSGMADVSSVLATGNIIFSSDQNPQNLKEILEKSLSQYFSYEAFLFLRNEDEVKEIVTNCPFEKRDDFHIYAFITTSDTQNLLLSEFKKCKLAEGENAAVVAKNFYWQVPKGNTLDSEFGKILGKKALKPQITSRNLNTFEKIINKF